MVGYPSLAFGRPGHQHFRDDRFQGGSVRLDCARQGIAAKGAEPHPPGLHALGPGQHQAIIVHDDQRAITDNEAAALVGAILADIMVAVLDPRVRLS